MFYYYSRKMSTLLYVERDREKPFSCDFELLLDICHYGGMAASLCCNSRSFLVWAGKCAVTHCMLIGTGSYYYYYYVMTSMRMSMSQQIHSLLVVSCGMVRLCTNGTNITAPNWSLEKRAATAKSAHVVSSKDDHVANILPSPLCIIWSSEDDMDHQALFFIHWWLYVNNKMHEFCLVMDV